MTTCEQLMEQMPRLLHGGAEWSPAEREHVAHCRECAGEWRLVQVGAGLDRRLVLDADRIAAAVRARLAMPIDVLPLRRLPWRNFALGLAAAASVALAVWVPSRRSSEMVAMMPESIGPKLPRLSIVTEEDLDLVDQSLEHRIAGGVPGAVPHLGDLTQRELDQLSQWTESP